MQTGNDFDNVVLEMMNDYGVSGRYIKHTAGAYSPAIGAPVITTTEWEVQAIVMDLTLQSNGYSTKYGTMVQAGDKEVYVRPPNKLNPIVPPLLIDPATDVIEVSGVTYKVVTQKEINPTGTDPIVYMLYVRK